MRGQIVDAQACFNLNAINYGVVDLTSIPYAARIFQQLLINLQVELLQARQVTAALRDWIDRDDKPVRGGAEDEVYMGMEPPYLAANQPMQDVSELRLIRGNRCRALPQTLPYVCVLPTSDLSVNVNTLLDSQAPLLAALFLTKPDSLPVTELLQQRPVLVGRAWRRFLTRHRLRTLTPVRPCRYWPSAATIFWFGYMCAPGNTCSVSRL